MKKVAFLLIAVVALFTSTTAQNTKPTLQVVGTAHVTVKPDLGVLHIAVQEIKPTMGAAIKALGEKSNYYNSLLKKLGFAETTIKTTGFNVYANKVYRDNGYVDSGYVATQTIRLEFTYNQQTIQKIVTEFSKSDKPIDFSFAFELSEDLKKATQQQAIELCVKDANDKAATMVKAAKVKLVGIKSISYGTGGGSSAPIMLERKAAYMNAADTNSAPAFNFTPNDIDFQDNILIEWNIE